MLMPKCGKRLFPSKVQYEPGGPSSFQRESQALMTNQPSLSTTRPFLLLRSGPRACREVHKPFRRVLKVFANTGNRRSSVISLATNLGQLYASW